jgi:hypothetical protein
MSDPNDTALLQSATKGFECLFNNEIDEAKRIFNAEPDSPFHLTGNGVCAFLEAALGMEVIHLGLQFVLWGVTDHQFVDYQNG